MVVLRVGLYHFVGTSGKILLGLATDDIVSPVRIGTTQLLMWATYLHIMQLHKAQYSTKFLLLAPTNNSLPWGLST